MGTYMLERTGGKVRLWPATSLKRLLKEEITEASPDGTDDARRRCYRLRRRGRPVWPPKAHGRRTGARDPRRTRRAVEESGLMREGPDMPPAHRAVLLPCAGQCIDRRNLAELHEIGIRMALGAQKRDVLGLVIKERAVLGLAFGWAGMRFSGASVQSYDPVRALRQE